MSLPVPLTVRIGDRHVTQMVEGLSFRREAVGGVRSLSLKLRAPADSAPEYLTPLDRIDIFDASTAKVIAQGRLADTGRATDGTGQEWDVVAFGPAQHASDYVQPLIYIETGTGNWREVSNTRGASLTSGANPNTTPSGSTVNGLVMTWALNTDLQTGDVAAMRYDQISETGQKLGGYQFLHQEGGAVVGATIDALASTGGDWSASNVAPNVAWTTTLTLGQAVVVTDFTNGRDTLDLRMNWNGAATTTGGGWWAWFENIVVQAMRYSRAGVELTTGYTASFIEAHDVVEDLLGRGVLGDYDGANATIDTSGSVPITQLAYPSGATPAQVLDDLMQLEPAYRWRTTPDTTGDGYGFVWEVWPTAVRYEATLEDGGSFPMSTQDLYNRVLVRWNDGTRQRLTLRVLACPILDDAGLDRQAVIDLGTEAGSEAQAELAGDNFLAEHNVPKNGGTLSVARPILDLAESRWVQPWEIEAGELVLVKGIESFPDELNADDSDGQSVFRIFAVDYTSDDNRASLSLDADPKTTSAALAKLLTQRTRR